MTIRSGRVGSLRLRIQRHLRPAASAACAVLISAADWMVFFQCGGPFHSIAGSHYDRREAIIYAVTS